MKNIQPNLTKEQVERLYQEFPTTSVCRADLEQEGFDTSALTDSDMAELASKMADAWTGSGLFWQDLNDIAEESLGFPKRLKDNQ